MKVVGSPLLDPGRRLLEQAYGVKTDRPALATGGAQLDLGLLLKGKVVAIDESGRLTVQTEKGLFSAASASTALGLGREFWFQVVQAGSSPLLAEAGKVNALFDLLRVVLPELLAAGSDPALASSPSLPATSPLARFLAETQVDGNPAPLKLIRMISRLGSAGEGGAPPPLLAKSLFGAMDDAPAAGQKLARMLEAHVQVNLQPPTPGGNDYCLFPVFFAEQMGRGEWMYAFANDQEGSDGRLSSAATLSFYLAMSQLGDLHLSLLSRPGRLTGTFTLSTPEAAEHVRQNLPELCAALEPLYGGSVAITCRSAASDCLTLLKDDLTASLGLARFALVDVSA